MKTDENNSHIPSIDREVILVRTANEIITRKGNITEINVTLLENNINVFLTQIQSIIDQSPKAVGSFGLKKLVVSAEITGSGKLILLGSGFEATTKGSLTFEFERGPDNDN